MHNENKANAKRCDAVVAVTARIGLQLETLFIMNANVSEICMDFPFPSIESKHRKTLKNSFSVEVVKSDKKRKII